jgi:hypothetical protein
MTNGLASKTSYRVQSAAGEWVTITTELRWITPPLARELLKRNTDNRPLRPSHVTALRAAMTRGEWQHTHQCIAFSSDGDLLDGQHRLEALSGMLDNNFAILMEVKTGFDRNTVFPVIDTTFCKRSMADVLRVSRGYAEVGAFLASIYGGRVATTPAYATPFLTWATPLLDQLLDHAARTRRTWSTAPVRSAAIIAIKMRPQDKDYVIEVYSQLVNDDRKSMSPIVESLCRAFSDSQTRKRLSYDLFVRCLKIFDPHNADFKKVQIKDQAQAIANVRDWLGIEVHGTPKRVPHRPGTARAPASQAHIEGL